MTRAEGRRLFVIEPGLNKPGHPAEVTWALQREAQRQRIPFRVIGPKTMDPNAAPWLNPIIRELEHECFPVLDRNATAFAHVLSRLRKTHSLGARDLVIVTSAHLNELLGAAEFLNSIGDANGPRIALNIHQVLPPAKIAEDMLSPDYVSTWERCWRRAFTRFEASNSALRCWTAPCHELSRTLSRLASATISQLPFAIDIEESGDVLARPVGWPLTVAFVGDGRQEKGLRGLEQ